MKPASDRFFAMLRTSHLVATQCLLVFPEDPTPVPIPVESGAVTLDRTAQIRRSGTVQIPWSLQVGADLGLDLRTLPLGGYCIVSRGLRYADGTTELMQLGTLRVESVTWRTSDESASLELADRMAQVRDEPFLSPYVPTATASTTKTGTLADGSATITAISPDTTGLLVGMTVEGVGVPAGRRIASVDSASQVTLNGLVNIGGLKDGRVSAGNPVITQLSDTTDLTPGMVVTAPTSGDLQPGTTIVAVESPSSIRVAPTPIGSGDQQLNFNANPVQSLTFGGGVKIADAAIRIVQDVFGTSIAYQKLFDPAAVLIDTAFSQDRAEAIGTLALAVGGEAYFNSNGDFVFDQQAGATDPVWTVDAGEQGNMVGADESLTRTGVYNGVLFTGQNAATDAPVSALVTHDDPTSPTRWGGPFGKVARVEQSSTVQTVEQATDAAQTLLARRLTLQRSLTVATAPNPALEPGDVVTVVFPDGRSEDQVIDVIRIALGPVDAQSLVVHATTEPAAGQLAPRRRVGVFHGAAVWRELNRARLVTA